VTATPWLSVKRGDAPLLVSVPHTGIDLAVQPTQPIDLGLQGRMVRREIGFAALVDFRLRRFFARAIERITVESIGRAQAGRRLAGIKRDAGGIAVDVDHRARNRRMHHGRAKASGEIVELVDPPVAIATAEPRRHQPGF
jgi:hypothetical protein